MYKQTQDYFRMMICDNFPIDLTSDQNESSSNITSDRRDPFKYAMIAP